MGAMDEFTKLKQIKDSLLKYEWSAEGNIVNGLRLFYDNGNRTSEYTLSETERKLLMDAMSNIERGGSSSTVSYNPYKVVATSIRNVFLHYCDQKLKLLAIRAEKEAKAILEALPP